MNKYFSAIVTACLVMAGSASAQTVIKYAHFQPADSEAPKHAAALAFKDHVESSTDGDILVQIYPASQLGGGVEVMQGLQLGTVELGVVHDGAIAPVYQPVQVFNIPYLFETQEEAWHVFDSPFVSESLADDMRQETGIKLMGMADNGIRHFTNSRRAIHSPEDMNDLKIRVQPGEIYQELVSSLGASPSVVSWPELPGALQQGVVDGQENGVTNILSASLYQYQEHVTLDGHIFSFHAYMMNDRFFNQLSQDEQAIVTEGIDIAEEIHRDMTAAQDNNAEEILSDVGMTVTTLTSDQIDAFREAAQPPVVDWAESEVGQQWVDGLFEALESY